jgi:hypothetical protein
MIQNTQRRTGMHSIPEFLRKAAFCHLVLLLLSSSVMAGQVPSRIDLYDGSDNHLMFITFKYDADGRNIGRTIYMADSTFMRDVAIMYDDNGRRISEISYNFNGDPIYTSNYVHSEDGTGFTLRDQFGLDLAGDRVIYSNVNPSYVGLVYGKSGDHAATVSYMRDSEGRPQRVDITNKNERDVYYGIFDYGTAIGDSRSGLGGGKLPLVSMRTQASRIAVAFNLRSSGEVRCELLTLSGRRAALLYNGRIPKGTFTYHFNPDRDAARLSSGVYLIKVSVNGTVVLNNRYLHQSAWSGGVR